MYILALDTSGKALSVALLENDTILTEICVNRDLNHSILLLPTIKRLYEITELTLATTDIFVCTVGPGSFTGLRVGVCTIKGFAIAIGKPIIAISTLDALAANGISHKQNICVLMDAGRGQLYAARYQNHEYSYPQRIGEEMLCYINDILPLLPQDTLLIGSGACKYAAIIQKALPASIIAPIADCHIKIGIVGLLGAKKFYNGMTSDALTLVPTYLHLSDAEKNLLAATDNSSRDIDKLSQLI